MSLSNSYLPYFKSKIDTSFSGGYSFKSDLSSSSLLIFPDIWRTLSSADTPVNVENFTSLDGYTLTYLGTQPGLFNVIYNISAHTTDADLNMGFSIFQNTDLIPTSQQTVTLIGSANSYSPISGSCIVYLSTNDTIAIKALSPMEDTIVIQNINLSIYSLE